MLECPQHESPCSSGTGHFNAPSVTWKKNQTSHLLRMLSIQATAAVLYWLVTKLPLIPGIFLREIPDLRAPSCTILRINKGMSAALNRTTSEPPQTINHRPAFKCTQNIPESETDAKIITSIYTNILYKLEFLQLLLFFFK